MSRHELWFFQGTFWTRSEASDSHVRFPFPGLCDNPQRGPVLFSASALIINHLLLSLSLHIQRIHIYEVWRFCMKICHSLRAHFQLQSPDVWRYEQKVGHYSAPRASPRSLRKGVFVWIEMLINASNQQTDLRDFAFNESISSCSLRSQINSNSPAQVSLLWTNKKVECFDHTASNNPPRGERG